MADDTERRINQLHNDVNAIYGMLDTIQEQQRSHDEKLDTLREQVNGRLELIMKALDISAN